MEQMDMRWVELDIEMEDTKVIIMKQKHGKIYKENNYGMDVT